MTNAALAHPRRNSNLAALICALLGAPPAPAQHDPGSGALEEIVVTAGFREHDLMASPGSVTVIDEAVIDDRAARHLESVLNTSPNIGYSGGASRARFVQIRGIGDLEQFVDPKHFPAVGIVADGINLGGTANAGMLFDVGQVEISRGPQGTAFGTSALAGLVTIRANRPTDFFEGYGQVGVGDYGGWHAGAVISGPVAEAASARLAVHRNIGDGYVDNRFLGRNDTNGYDETTVRASAQFNPDGNSAYGLTALYFDGENGYDAFSLENSRTTLSDQPGRDNQETLAVAARGEWQLGGSRTLEALATWLNSDLEYAFDEDWTYVGICDGTLCDPVLDFFSNTDNYLRERREVSFDVRLLGELSPGIPIQYVFGAYAQRRDEDLHRRYYGDFFSFYDTDRRALYGQLDFTLNERWGVTAGLRYEDFDDGYRDTFDFRSSSDDRLRSGELTLSYDAGSGYLIYATIARGAKAGGVNTEASSNLPFMQPVFRSFVEPRLHVETETLINREIGFKGAYLNGRLDLRAAVFHMLRRDAQLESWMWDGVNFLWIGFLDNADGTNWGAEVESAYQLSDRVQLFGSLGWLRTEVEEITTYDLDADDFVVRNGIDQAKSPGWQYHVGANVAFNDRLSAYVALEGRDSSRFGYYHEQSIGRYDLLNASLRYRLGNAEIRFWGRNLTDEEYPVHALYFGNDPRKGWINETYYQFGEPRVVGVSAGYSF